ncbi:MAG: SAM-dependent methyltransferase [Rhodanobacteraceae bacterium]|nr:MAG: SAM-dependent methyltransferase [Rhodanobacteraceae bacterium]
MDSAQAAYRVDFVGPVGAEYFSRAERAAVEQRCTLRGKKVYVRCLVRDKDVLAKPEEIVRQLWLERLTRHYGYPLQRLVVEFPITFGRDSSKRADIVILDADRPTVAYCIVEVKKTTAKDGKDQLKSYTHATGAPLALWSNGGADPVIWHRKNPNYFVEISDLPRAAQTIADIVDQPWTIQTLIEKEEIRARDGSRARSLRDLIEDMEDEVLANAGVDVFEEVFKLVFTKLYDELACYRGRYKALRFRNQNSAAQMKAAIQELFDEAQAEWPGVFAPNESIRLTPDHLAVCVGALEEWKLFNSNLDVIDDAFEYLVNQSAKGEKGQYFTPRWVIDLCVKMLNPNEHETLIDTAAGSAGFTVHAIFHVWRRILDDMGLPQSHLFTMDDKPQRCKDYVRDKVFAIDFDEKSVRVARCLNLIAGDGQTNVLHLNTLDWKKWGETTRQQDWLDTYNDGWKRLRKLRAKKDDDRAFNFDVLMANPPFAGDIRQSEMLSPYELAHKKTGKLENAVGRDLLFIERNLDFLKPGGRMAVVLPQGRFNNASDQRVREFIAERCRILAVVGLHPSTFKPHTGTKTSVLFVQKWNDDPVAGPLCPHVDDYEIFFATQRLPSKDNSGDKILVKGDDGLPLRDSHGHYVVQHDFFNHDGKTQDGIAEAFAEFGAKEKLSFF